MTASRRGHACSFAFPPSAYISPTTDSASPSDTTQFARTACDCLLGKRRRLFHSLSAPQRYIVSLTRRVCYTNKQAGQLEFGYISPGFCSRTSLPRLSLLSSTLCCYRAIQQYISLQSNMLHRVLASAIHKLLNGASHHHSDHSAGPLCPVRSFR
jgi:hypothetical protein